jgi:hypothetical protein
MPGRREAIVKELEDRLGTTDQATLAERAERMAELMALGEPIDGRILFGQAHDALFEAQWAYISGLPHCTILAVQVCLEKLLSGQVSFYEMGEPQRSYARLLKFARDEGLLSAQDYELFDRLRLARNPVAHHREIDDPGHPLRRSMTEGAVAEDLVAKDAQSAIRALIEFVNRRPFALGPLMAEFSEDELIPAVHPGQLSLLPDGTGNS